VSLDPEHRAPASTTSVVICPYRTVSLVLRSGE